MAEYHKIQTVYNRDPETNFKTLIEGQFALPEFEYLRHNHWVFTEKVDGTNIRVYFENGHFVFGGRTDKAQIPTKLINRLNDRFIPLAGIMSGLFNDARVCLYGEGYGAGIQKGGGHYRPDQDFVLFDIRINDWWLQRHDVQDIATKLGLEIVPIVGSGTLDKMVQIAREGISSAWGDFIAEGIVARPATELRTRSGNRIITKIKYRDFS